MHSVVLRQLQNFYVSPINLTNGALLLSGVWAVGNLYHGSSVS